MDDLSRSRNKAVDFILAWLDQSPSPRQIAAVANCCNWQIPEVNRLIDWISAHPNCPAEAALKLLDASGFWNASEEELREDDPAFLHSCAQLMERLRQRSYCWIAATRTPDKPFPFEVRFGDWSAIPEIDLIPAYGNIRDLAETLPEEIKDAFEILGCRSGERVARVARQLLIDKGYDPDEI